MAGAKPWSRYRTWFEISCGPPEREPAAVVPSAVRPSTAGVVSRSVHAAAARASAMAAAARTTDEDRCRMDDLLRGHAGGPADAARGARRAGWNARPESFRWRAKWHHRHDEVPRAAPGAQHLFAGLCELSRAAARSRH